MTKEVIQKEFKDGVVGKLAVGGLVVVGAIGVFTLLEAKPPSANQLPPETPSSIGAQPPATAAEPPPAIPGQMPNNYQGVHGGNDVTDASRSIRGSDDYVVATHNLSEGARLKAGDLKIVKMPLVVGYELAFYKLDNVNGLTLSHAVPEGQPVLPYHVEEALRNRTYLNPKP